MAKASSSSKFPFKLGETVVEPTIGICTVAGNAPHDGGWPERDFYIFQAGNAKVMVSTLAIAQTRHPPSDDQGGCAKGSGASQGALARPTAMTRACSIRIIARS
jgi:hypothetical protein